MQGSGIDMLRDLANTFLLKTSSPQSIDELDAADCSTFSQAASPPDSVGRLNSETVLLSECAQDHAADIPKGRARLPLAASRSGAASAGPRYRMHYLKHLVLPARVEVPEPVVAQVPDSVFGRSGAPDYYSREQIDILFKDTVALFHEALDHVNKKTVSLMMAQISATALQVSQSREPPYTRT